MKIVILLILVLAGCLVIASGIWVGAWLIRSLFVRMPSSDENGTEPANGLLNSSTGKL